jgi:hypothetical protein
MEVYHGTGLFPKGRYRLLARTSRSTVSVPTDQPPAAPASMLALRGRGGIADASRRLAVRAPRASSFGRPDAARPFRQPHLAHMWATNLDRLWDRPTSRDVTRSPRWLQVTMGCCSRSRAESSRASLHSRPIPASPTDTSTSPGSTGVEQTLLCRRQIHDDPDVPPACLRSQSFR